jgi:hypothetical protein
MLPTTNPQSIPTPSSLSPEDRTKLSLLFRTRGDAVSFAHLREEDPLETLAWLDQPHIKPWHDAIRAAHREHEQTETHLALARALKDITRILDLEADSKLRIRAVNAIIKLANAIHRGTRPAPVTPRERHRAEENAEDAALSLKVNLERRAFRALNLEDANAPVGAKPIDTEPSPGPTIGPLGPLGPITAILPTRRIPKPTLNGAHLNGKHPTARAGTPRPPPDNRRPRKRRHRR